MDWICSTGAPTPFRGTATTAADSDIAGRRIVSATPVHALQAVITLRLRAEGAIVACVDPISALTHQLAGACDHDVLVIDADRLMISVPQLDRLTGSLAVPEHARVARVLLRRQSAIHADGVAETREHDVVLAKPAALKTLCAAIAAAFPGSGSPAIVETIVSVAPRVESMPVLGRVLVADDNPVNQLVAEAMPATLGYQAESASEGRGALQLLSTAHFDMVLMDCEMPVMDGRDATRRLRAEEQGKRHMTVIGLTAHASAEARAACLAAGMDDFLSRPYTLDELAAVLARRTPSPRNTTECATPDTAPVAAPASPLATAAGYEINSMRPC